jgi:hypothetical protein
VKKEDFIIFDLIDHENEDLTVSYQVLKGINGG